MNVPLLTALSFALLLTVAALCREVRLRRALQELLRRLFTLWRTRPHEKTRLRDVVRRTGQRDRRLRNAR